MTKLRSVKAARNPKLKGKESRWEKKRRKKRARRKAQGKKPLAELLTIAPLEERNAALKDGKMLFYAGRRKISVPLVKKATIEKVTGFFYLQGVYKISPGKIIVMRTGLASRHPSMFVFELSKGKKNISEKLLGWFYNVSDLGHMEINEEIRGRGLGVKAVSKTERSQRSRKHGSHEFPSMLRFVERFEKLGYEKMRHETSMFGTPRMRVKKTGKEQPEDNMLKNHRIEAIDPKTGRARIFTFPRKKPPQKKK